MPATASEPTVPTRIRRSLAILAATRAIGHPEREVPDMEERIGRVVAVFERLGARWALVGAHAIGALTEPRATADFDFVIEESRFREVLAALEKELGDLDAIDLGPAMRLRALDVDLIRSTTHVLFREALDRSRAFEEWQMPVPEVLLVLKFLAAVSPWRERTKRMQDMVDLSALFLAVGRHGLDEDLIQTLAAQVYPGAESELEALLQRIESGEPLTI